MIVSCRRPQRQCGRQEPNRWFMHSTCVSLRLSKSSSKARLTIRAWDALKASNGSVVFMSGSAALDPKPGFAAVAAVNAAIIALAKAFAEQGIKDDVQVNSIVPGAVMTGRRRSFFEKWAPAHNLTVEDAIRTFPEEVGIARFGKPEEIADLISYLV